MSKAINLFFTYIQQNVIFTCIIIGVIFLAMTISLAVIFHKIGKPFWKGLIPIYNIIVLLDTLEIPVWMMLLYFIPFVNILGIPSMGVIIGWNLGSYCYKNIGLKVGLCLFPPLFYPILAATEIDINKPYNASNIQIVQVKKEFTLEPVMVTNVVDVPQAMSLGDQNTIAFLEPLQKKTKIAIPKKEATHQNNFDIMPTANAQEVEDLNKVLPTADDLTFDYNSMYQKEEKKVQRQEQPVQPIDKKIGEDTTTLDYNTLYQQEQPVEKEVLPVIHDVVLESAEPITGDIGPIPINRRYDFQHPKKEEVQPIIEKPVIEQPVIVAPIEVGPVEPVLDAPMMAASPFIGNSTPVTTSDIQLPMAQENAIPSVEPVVEMPQMDQVMSMNIAEPGELPVGILLTEDKKKKKEKETEEVAVIPDTRAPFQYEMTKEEAMGFGNYRFTNPNVQTSSVPEPNYTGIFQTENNGSLLRPVEQPSAPAKKTCPQCGFALNVDCPTCLFCGYKF